MMTPASADPSTLNPAHDVVVAGGACVIHSDRPLSEGEQQYLRNEYRTEADVRAGLVVGNAMRDALEGMLGHFNTKLTEVLEGAGP